MIFSFFRKQKPENEIVKTYLSVNTGTGEKWEIPKIEIKSKYPGPVIVLTSGIHGDEVSGNIILLKFCDFFKKNPLGKGKVVALIGINQQGSKILKREIPVTNEDLNRLFPGKEDGTIGERIAHKVTNEVLSHEPDLVIDIHNDSFFSTPYFLIDPESISDKKTHSKTILYGHKSGLVVIEERPDEVGTYAKSFSAYFMKNKIPAVTLEAGSDKVLVRKHVLKVFNALLKLCLNEGMIKKVKTINFKYPKKYKNKVLMDSYPFIATQRGSVKYSVEPDTFIKKGGLMAKIYDDFGDNIQKIFADKDYFVVGHNEKTYIEKGDELFWLADLK